MAGLDLQAILSGQPATPSAPTATASAPSYSAEDIQAMVRQAAAQYGIDPDVAVRWAQQESSFDPQAKSKKGALGVLQLMPATAQAYGVKDPTDPAQNIDGGMRYLADLRKKYGDDAKAFAAYNAGPDAVDKAGGVPNIPETKNYVQTILGNPTSNASGSAAAPQALDLAGILKGAAATPGAAGEPGPDPSAQAPTIAVKNGKVVFGDTGQAVPDAQVKMMGALLASGRMDKDGKIDGVQVHMQRNPGDQITPGDYYISAGPNPSLAGGPQDKSAIGAAGSGVVQGLSDVALSGMDLASRLTGGRQSGWQDFLRANQDLYNAAEHNGGTNPYAAFGRFVGQSAPLTLGLTGLEALGAKLGLAAKLGPVGEFLAGGAGQTELPATATLGQRVGQLALRGMSSAARGAQEGAITAPFVASANPDQSLGSQVAAGAVGGGLLRPAGDAVESVASRLLGQPDLTGAAGLTDQERTQAAAQGLPVPVPLSLGQVTGAPAQQLAENALLKGVEGDRAAGVMQTFRSEQQGALRGNAQAIPDQIAGKPFTPGEGASAAQAKLDAMKTEAKAQVDAAYQAARASGDDAMLPSGKDARNLMLDGLRTNFDLSNPEVDPVAKLVESFGANGAPTARELFEFRTKLTNYTASNNQAAAAARNARSSLDGYIDSALTNDLFVGDPKAVRAWKDAISQRRAMGQTFESGDLIDSLTERVPRGGGMTLKVDPHDAANFIFNASDLGFISKPNLTRDLTRLRDVLGPDSDEWNGLRAEVFSRVARAGEGAAEGAEPQFSGQKFFNAWNRVKQKSPQIVTGLFSPDEIQTINDFASTAQRATTPVKGGDNSSNSGFVMKALGGPLMQVLGAAAGAGVGGAAGMHAGGAEGGYIGAGAGLALGAFLKQAKELLAAGKARKFTYGAAPVEEKAPLASKLLGSAAPGVVGAVGANAYRGLPTPGQ